MPLSLRQTDMFVCSNTAYFDFNAKKKERRSWSGLTLLLQLNRMYSNKKRRKKSI